MTDQPSEPGWLRRMCGAAVQRPRRQFVKIRWHDLQDLVRERDALWHAATPETKAQIEGTRAEYGRSSY